MLKARDIMTREIKTVSPETKIEEAARLLLEHHFNGLPVVDRDGRLVGIICQEDLIVQQRKLPLPSVFPILGAVIPLTSSRQMDREMHKIAAVTVAEAMTPHPVTVSLETPIDEIATLMVEKNIHTLPVADQGALVGIIGKEDILRTLMSP